MNLEQTVEHFIDDSFFRKNIVNYEKVSEQQAAYLKIPDYLDDNIKKNLLEMGIGRLYSHQREALDLYNQKKNFVITTPTASGKTLSYLLPILQDKMKDPSGKHLFMFPTKALAQDQLALFRRWKSTLKTNWQINTFDGDTPIAERRAIKKSGDFILSNPDMLHSGILPHHITWKSFFDNLKTIVIDEMHTYLGVFGSHVANVLRRLNRILKYYNSNPIFIFSSATIANPTELAELLSEKEFELVDKSGAPEGIKHFLFYNPPIIGKPEEEIRQSPYKAAASIGEFLISNHIPTIFFARSRVRTELLLNQIRNRLPWNLKNKIQGYRGGYLPLERRKIEQDLREGNLLGVVSTNALELGIDIGMLQAVVSIGYPGRISSILQQFGRAGRQKDSALAIMIAGSNPLDQYLLTHTQSILNSKGESAIIHPDNLTIFMDHIKCAAYEHRFNEQDFYGGHEVKEYMEYLVENKVLHNKGGFYLWMDQTYPAASISLRSAASTNFTIVDVTIAGKEKVIGEVDYFSAPTLIHQEAIYMHRGVHYFVKELNWEQRQAKVEKVKVDYYTDGHENIDFSVLFEDDKKEIKNIDLTWGNIKVITKADLYKKIKISTNENLGYGQINTPEIELHTQSAWLEVTADFLKEIQEIYRGGVINRLAYVLHNLSPLIALCDLRDIHVLGLYKDNKFKDMTILFYDSYPGGVGLSFKIMQNLESLLQLSYDSIRKCECQNGCPSCIGVWVLNEHEINRTEDFSYKKTSIQLLKKMLTQF